LLCAQAVAIPAIRQSGTMTNLRNLTLLRKRSDFESILDFDTGPKADDC
jgi:hypothetical protein